LETNRLKEILKELGKLGIKSIMYAGEGEPFLHKDMAEIIKFTKESGIDAAVASNGVLFSEELADKCLPYMTWIKFSVNAGTKESYKKIHRGGENDFEKMLKNIAYAVNLKKKNNYNVALGVQFLLLPENKNEVVSFAELLKSLGLDYLAIKPFISHPLSIFNKEQRFSYKGLDLTYLEEKLDKISENNFKVIFRKNVFEKLEKEDRGYKKCFGLPFFAEITSDGNVYSCGPHLGEEKFCYGNIYQNSFREIWESEKRKEVLKMVEALDVNKCMKCCRLDEINKYLWELKNLPPHVNFI
jgi:radical SAM protein with 4Fe4S-binding SPASM domain